MPFSASLKDEIKRMIPVRGMSIIDRKLKDFISIDSPKKKAVPIELQKGSKSFRSTSIGKNALKKQVTIAQ